MPLPTSRGKKIAFALAVMLLVLVLTAVVLAPFLIEPTLRKKIHSLIVEGSGGLYRYSLGTLDASFVSGNVEIENLQISIDSNRYRQLEAEHALPSFTAQLSLQKAHIKGIGIVNLLLGKKITIDEIASEAVNVRFMRHPKKEQNTRKVPPLWKAMQPALKSIAVDRIRLDSIKFLFKSNDTATFMKLQFDRFDARLDDLRIDSAAAADTTRLAFSKDIFLRWHDLKYRTADSAYKMKAEWITYSLKDNLAEVDSFKLQPTLHKEDFYRITGQRKSLYYAEFDKIRMTGLDLARFFHNDALVADSFVVNQPRLSVYLDKTQERVFSSKMGSFPHQKLRNASSLIHFNHIVMRQGKVEYVEKNDKTRQEGRLQLQALNLHIRNATNDSAAIQKNPLCTAKADARLMGSPLNLDFVFYLDSANARFDVSGTVRNMNAAQLNQLSVPMANIYLPSLQLHQLNFAIRADEWTAYSDVDMRYNNLALVMRSMNESGQAVTNGFLTKLINRFVLHPANPGGEGIERKARNVRFMRLTTQTFFGMIWKSLFAGMQAVMLKSGQVE